MACRGIQAEAKGSIVITTPHGGFWDKGERMSEMNLGIGSNPYVANQAKALQAQSNLNLQQNVLPGIGQGAQAAGMYGSSRQGIAQGQAIGNAQTGLDSAIANLYSTAYGQDQNAQLQRDQMANQSSIANAQMANQLAMAKISDATNRYGMDNQYSLGMGNLGLGFRQANNSYDLGLRANDLGFANLDANIANNNFGNQMQAANFGMGVYNTLNNQTQAGINAGTQIQNTPLDYQKYFTNSANGVGSGYGTSNTSQTNQGNPWLGALGGAMMGNQIQKNWG